jgi:hypothetical protein
LTWESYQTPSGRARGSGRISARIFPGATRINSEDAKWGLNHGRTPMDTDLGEKGKRPGRKVGQLENREGVVEG